MATSKKDVKAAADKAEAQAAARAKKEQAKKDKAAAAEAAKPPKAEKPAAKPDKVKKIDFNSPMNEDEQKCFNQHLPVIVAQIAKANLAVSDLRNLYKKAKGDGFEKADFDIARAIETAEGEAKEKAKIARKLTVAKFRGKALGSQLDMFLTPDRTPSSEIAFEEGKIASQSNQAAKPGYDPSTEQHRQYMAGYHQEQERQLKGGITKPEPVQQAAPAPAPAKPPPEPASSPPSGMGMTRADYEKQRQIAKEAGAAISQKPSTAIDDDDDDDALSAFKKKEIA